jgi:membrane peptidoglycan carboxypeptidase
MVRSRAYQLWTLLLAGVLAGVIVAAGALPVIGSLGAAAKSASFAFDELPAELSTPPTAQRSHLYAADGTTLITSFYEENRIDVPLDEVATVLQQAVVAAEDARFYEHAGVDFRGVLRAFVANRVGGEVRQGASTLTMQYVRNVRKSDPNLTPEERAAATATSAGRKIQEMRYALALEQRLSKAEILNRYLNIAYFGSGAYGVAAASWRYFSKSPAELTLSEAALLAGLLQSPHTDSPIDGDADRALARRAYVLDRMAENGMVTAEEAQRAAAEPVELRPGTEPNDCAGVPADRSDWGFFCDYFVKWWNSQPAFGETVEERRANLLRGGYRIVSSLDADLQAEAMEQVLTVYGYDEPRAMPLAVVEPGTGRVRVLAVNRHYSLAPNPTGQRNHPNTVNQLIAGGGAIVGYQAGSTFKIFTLLAALEAGLPLATTYDSPGRLVTEYPISGANSCGGYWCPSNANPDWMNGERDMWTGFGRSVNTYFVQLEQAVGADRVVEMAQRLGITFRAAEDARLAAQGAAAWGAFTLGVSATTPLDLANAYATLAAEGSYCEPLPVTEVLDRSGRVLPVGEPRCSQVLDAEVARAATDAARCPVGDRSAYGRCDGGTATATAGILDRPVAGKTGTSEENSTTAFVAYTPQLAAAAIAANPDDPGDHVGAVTQQVVAGVARTLAVGLRDEPIRGFAAPSPEIAFGVAGPADPDVGSTPEPGASGTPQQPGVSGPPARRWGR